MIDYYDGVLMAIVGCILGGLAVSLVTGVGVRAGVSAGTLGATLFVYDAIFRHPPVPPIEPVLAVPLVVWHVVVLVLAVTVGLG